jgi:hypothetical protein
VRAVQARRGLHLKRPRSCSNAAPLQANAQRGGRRALPPTRSRRAMAPASIR